MQPSRLHAHQRQQRASEGTAQRQHQHGIAHGRGCDRRLPAGQCAALGVLINVQPLGLKGHARGPGTNDAIGQGKRLEVATCPARLRSSLHLPHWCLVLQVHGQRLAAGLAGVDVYAHGQQHAAQVCAVALEHLHGHGPLSPVAARVSKAQQAPEVVARAVEGDGFDVQRAADALLRQRRRRIA